MTPKKVAAKLAEDIHFREINEFVARLLRTALA
jgi:hypothetical protein